MIEVLVKFQHTFIASKRRLCYNDHIQIRKQPAVPAEMSFGPLGIEELEESQYTRSAHEALNRCQVSISRIGATDQRTEQTIPVHEPVTCSRNKKRGKNGGANSVVTAKILAASLHVPTRETATTLMTMPPVQARTAAHETVPKGKEVPKFLVS